MSTKIPGGRDSPGRRFVTGGRAGRVPPQSRLLFSSRKLNDSGHGRAPRRPGKGPDDNRGNY